MSRVESELARRELEIQEPGWTCGLTFDNEAKAKQEFAWLKAHNNYREYLLVAIIDKLDDTVPF